MSAVRPFLDRSFHNLVALGALATAFAGCTPGAAAPHGGAGAGLQRPPPPVVVAEAVARDAPVYLDHIGRIAPREVVSVRPQVSGKMTAAHFKDGAELEEGAPLFTIDPRPFQAALDQAVATHAERAANLALARTELARVEGMAGGKAISQEDLEARRSAVGVGEARVASAAAAVEAARVNLEFTSIRSPLRGRAGRRLVDAGNVVGPESGALVVIQSVDPVYAEFTIPETQLDEVRRAMAATATALAVEVSVPQAAGAPARGELAFVDAAVQPASGTVLLRATLPNPDRRFWPGQFVSARLVLSVKRGAILVPADAVQIGQSGPYVYVVKADSTAELRPVTPGQAHDGLVVIEGGVAAGEEVITTGQLAVMPGAKVAARAAAPEGPAGR